MIVIMYTDGSQAIWEVPKPPTLEEMQKLVAGYVELITPGAAWDGQQAEVYCNEEGKLKNMPVNALATKYIRTQIPAFWDVLVGDVVLLVGDARWADSSGCILED